MRIMTTKILSVVNKAKVGVTSKKKAKSVRFSSSTTTYQPVFLLDSNPLIESKTKGSMDPAEKDKDNFEGGTALSPTSTVEISISCRNLDDKDLLSKSDPICVVFHKPRRSNHWLEYMRTEIIQNNLNPDFAVKATIEYRFEMQQNLRFEVYDIDKPTSKLVDQDSIGFVECTLAQIVSAGAAGLTLNLTTINVEDSPTAKPRVSGSIILIAEELAALKDEITLGGTGIGSRTCCIPPRVLYTVSKITETGSFIVVYRSPRVRSKNPTWQVTTISLSSLCGGDKDRKLKFECCEETLKGEDRTIGFCTTTVNKLVMMGSGGIRLQAPDGKDINSTLLILSCKIVQIYTFVDYIQNGTKIHCAFSIDFTSSNGDPSEPSSLHHFSQVANRPNPYEQAIQSVGSIIQDYDDEHLFPVYGFGARIPPVGAVSHNFFVSLKESPYCQGINGVLETYRNCIRQIQLYGPTNFSPVIRHVAEVAAQSKNGEDYYVLLIITDGVITDMPQTKEAIVNASPYPLSIIIVGVGGADFESMEELDGDAVRLSYNGRFAERDIVQFVPYRDAYSWLATTSGPTAGTGSWSGENNVEMTNKFAQSQLAEEVLAEIPEQLTGYMKSKGIFPTIAQRVPTPIPVTPSQPRRETDQENPQQKPYDESNPGQGQQQPQPPPVVPVVTQQPTTTHQVKPPSQVPPPAPAPAPIPSQGQPPVVTMTNPAYPTVQPVTENPTMHIPTAMPTMPQVTSHHSSQVIPPVIPPVLQSDLSEIQHSIPP